MGKRPAFRQTGTEEIWLSQRKGQEAGIWRLLGGRGTFWFCFLGGLRGSTPTGPGRESPQEQPAWSDAVLMTVGGKRQGGQDPVRTAWGHRGAQEDLAGPEVWVSKLGKHWDSPGGPPFSVRWDHHFIIWLPQVSYSLWIKTFVNTPAPHPWNACRILWKLIYEKNHFSIKTTL